MNKNATIDPLVEFASKSGEIAIASAQTVGYRMLLMAGVNTPVLTRRERAEFSRMYTEKLLAIMEYGQIMVREMTRLNQQLVTVAWSELVSTGTAVISLSTGRNPADAFTAQSRLISSAGRHARDASQKILTAMSRAAIEGLAPVHTAVTANAIRLRRRRR